MKLESKKIRLRVKQHNNNRLCTDDASNWTQACIYSIVYIAERATTRNDALSEVSYIQYIPRVQRKEGI